MQDWRHGEGAGAQPPTPAGLFSRAASRGLCLRRRPDAGLCGHCLWRQGARPSTGGPRCRRARLRRRRPGSLGALKLPPRSQLRADFRQLPPAERDGMIEVTDDGLRLPRISTGGWMPWIAYARRFDPSGPPARVGLLMLNLGADEALMQRAIEELPAEVSLAFLAGTPDLRRWLRRAREHGHECYLMLPVEDPAGPGERGIRPIEASADPAENLAALRAAMSRGEGYARLRRSRPGAGRAVRADRPAPDEGDRRARPVAGRDQSDRRVGDVPPHRRPGRGLCAQLDRAGLQARGPGQHRRATSSGWSNGPASSSNDGTPRHDFGVLQPNDAAIDAIVAWRKRLQRQNGVALVPIIGHFECREACMARVRVQPAQLRP